MFRDSKQVPTTTSNFIVKHWLSLYKVLLKEQKKHSSAPYLRLVSQIADLFNTLIDDETSEQDKKRCIEIVNDSLIKYINPYVSTQIGIDFSIITLLKNDLLNYLQKQACELLSTLNETAVASLNRMKELGRDPNENESTESSDHSIDQTPNQEGANIDEEDASSSTEQAPTSNEMNPMDVVDAILGYALDGIQEQENITQAFIDLASIIKFHPERKQEIEDYVRYRLSTQAKLNFLIALEKSSSGIFNEKVATHCQIAAILYEKAMAFRNDDILSVEYTTSLIIHCYVLSKINQHEQSFEVMQSVIEFLNKNEFSERKLWNQMVIEFINQLEVISYDINEKFKKDDNNNNNTPNLGQNDWNDLYLSYQYAAKIIDAVMHFTMVFQNNHEQTGDGNAMAKTNPNLIDDLRLMSIVTRFIFKTREIIKNAPEDKIDEVLACCQHGLKVIRFLQKLVLSKYSSVDLFTLEDEYQALIEEFRSEKKNQTKDSKKRPNFFSSDNANGSKRPKGNDKDSDDKDPSPKNII